MYIVNRICHYCILFLETSLIMAMLRLQHVGGTM